MYHKVPVTLSQAQFDKIRRGHPIQLAHHQIGHHGRHWLALHPESVKKVHSAHRKGKGTRVHVSPHEMEASGEGLKEFWDKLKNAGKWIKEKVIDTPFYQQNIRPVAHQLVDTGLQMVAPRLGSASNLATQGVHALGEQTGAFGLPKSRGRPKKKKHNMALVPYAGGALSEKDHAEVRRMANTALIHSGSPIPHDLMDGYYLPVDYSRVISPTHPANWPPYPALAPIGGGMKKRSKKGGSFLPA